ncbi:trans-sulfuration enzyme family protein [Photorhabdus laumondii]|uniref:trans-sulfuration enzyme family protein n=1 Tax=Photorhabdus laumondii TaxID=2218628 RepID=UPI0033162ECE
MSQSDISQKNTNRTMQLETRAIHSASEQFEDPYQAISPPLYVNASYTFETCEEAAMVFAGEKQRYVYGRVHNPTQSLLESRLADLEGAEAGVTFASGMAALSSVVWSLLQSGDVVVAHNKMYGNSYNLLTQELPKFGVQVILIDMTDLQQLREVLSDKTVLVFFEFPSNPLLELIDIQAVASLLQPYHAQMVVDSTLASPMMLRPIEHGADIVIHSLTKYIGGHGDVLGGVVLGREETMKTVRMHGLRCLTGATLSPLSAFLVLRGLKTLGIRMQRHSLNALAVAHFLEDHPMIKQVYYPGLASHPQYALATRLLDLYGGLISFEYRGDRAATQAFLDRLQLVKRAVSLGDVETLIQHPASMTHSAYPEEALQAYGIHQSLVRMSVGLEDVQDIVADLAQAFYENM